MLRRSPVLAARNQFGILVELPDPSRMISCCSIVLGIVLEVKIFGAIRVTSVVFAGA